MQLNRQWAYSLLTRMNFVEWKATAAKSKHSNVDFARLKQQFLADMVTTAEMEIPAELILNRDQTGIKIVPFSTWTMDAEGSKWVEVATTSTSSQQCSVVHSLEISYRWKWYTKAKPIAAIPTTSFLQIGSFAQALTKKPWCSMLTTSSYPM